MIVKGKNQESLLQQLRRAQESLMVIEIRIISPQTDEQQEKIQLVLDLS